MYARVASAEQHTTAIDRGLTLSQRGFGTSGERLKPLLLSFGLVVALLPTTLCAQRGYAVAAVGLPDAPLPQVNETTTPETTAPQITAPPAPSTPPSTSAPAPQATPAPVQETKQQRSQEALKAEEKQRMLGIMPAFNAVEGGSAEPLTPRGKFELWYKSALDPFTFVTAGLDAGLEQAENSYPEYHQGFVGFAKRYGASYADSVDGNFWGNAVLPVLFKQDPRYFRLGHGTYKHRLGYAIISTVRCKGDNGKWQPSYGNVLGNLIGGAISNVYYPASDRGAGLTFERGFTVTAEGAFGAIAFEFYPDAIAYLKRHYGKNHASAAPASPATQQ